MGRDGKKKLLKALVVLGSLALIGTGWIFLSRLERLGYVDSAIGTIRVVLAAETKFAQAHPDIGYSCTLSALPIEGLTAGFDEHGHRNEYAFEISGCRAGNAHSPNSKYQITARPLVSDVPAYCSDQSGILKYDESGSIQKCLENGPPID
jgi:hypothetical protein